MLALPEPRGLLVRSARPAKARLGHKESRGLRALLVLVAAAEERTGPATIPRLLTGRSSTQMAQVTSKSCRSERTEMCLLQPEPERPQRLKLLLAH